MTALRHRLGSVKVRPSPEHIAAILRDYPEGLRLRELTAQARTSYKNAAASAVDAIAAGLVARCGTASRNFRYAAAEHAAALQARILAREARMARKRQQSRLARERLVLAADDMEIRRLIVPAGSVPPPVTTGVRAVWELAR